MDANAAVAHNSGAPDSSEAPAPADEPRLGKDCDDLLKELAEKGIPCWLDSGSLLGLVRGGSLNAWEKDIDLGIWGNDVERVRVVCRDFAAQRNMELRERWLFGLPYAILLRRRNASGQARLPIAIHVFFRIGETAWSPQPHFRLAGKAKLARAQVRAAAGNDASLKRKLAALHHRPHEAFLIALGVSRASFPLRLGMKSLEVLSQSLGRPRHAAEFVLGRPFYALYEWAFPSRYFDNAAPLSGWPAHLLAPAPVEEYLELRYGDWRTPVEEWFYVLDDRGIAPLSMERLRLASEHMQLVT